MSMTTCTLHRWRDHAARPYHHGNLRAALLDGAERALAAGGDLSLRELAREVGVSHAAPRRHFPDKQALLDALAEDGFERLGAELRAAIAAPATSRRGCSRFARAYVALRDRPRRAARADVRRQAPPDAALRRRADRAFAAPLALIAEGQAAGEVVAGEPEQVGMVAFATLHGLAALVNNGMLDAADLDESSRRGRAAGTRPAPSLRSARPAARPARASTGSC